MDLVLLIFVIVVPILWFIASLYLFAYYSHSDEQEFAKSWITRIYTIFIILFGMLQQFFIALDLANKYSDGGLPLQTIFTVYYFTLAVLLFIILPFSTFYYESSEETSVYFRMRGAFFRWFIYAFLLAVIMTATFFITDSESDFQYYMIGWFMILGWFLLFFTLGAGLVAVPFDLIYSFIKRPHPIKQAEFEVQKKIVLDNLLLLRKRCNESLDERIQINNQKGFRGWWNNSRLTRRVASIHGKTDILEEEYIRLVKLSKFNKYIEPITYYFKLIIGILWIIINIIIIVQLLGWQLLSAEDIEGCSYDFLSTIVRNLSDESVGLGFISTGIILFLSVYLLLWAWYGNQKLGIRFVIYTYAPISSRETLYNNICHNVFLLNLWSAAITQLLIQAFKQSISEGGDTAWHEIFFNHINKFYFHRSMYKYSIFIYMTLFISLIFLIYMIISPSDLKVVLKKNQNWMKSYATNRDSKAGIKEPLVEN